MSFVIRSLGLILMASAPATGQAAPSSGVEIAPFVAREINPKVHLLTTPDDWYAAAIGNVVLIEQSDGFLVVESGLSAGYGLAVVLYERSLADTPL